jgi:hypothetical protein
MSEKARNFRKRKKSKNTDLGKGGWVEHEFYDLELPILRGPGGQGVHVPDQLVLKNINQFFLQVLLIFYTNKLSIVSDLDSIRSVDPYPDPDSNPDPGVQK